MSTATLKEWLAEHPPPDSAFKQTLAHVSERVRSGEDLQFTVREFLDEFSLLPRYDLKERAIGAMPLPTGDARADAYLGALAEHLALAEGIERPGWTIEPDRFLDRFWFVPETPAFWALAIVESPAAFRRRGVFISEGALQRVQRENRAEIVAALTALGAVLDSRGLRGEMYVVGGAAIALAFDTRRSAGVR